MKNNCISFPTPSPLFLISFFSILFLSSCGSYQNSSYYDTDGIYGTTEAGMRKRAIEQESATAYENYFSALQDTKDTTSVFTDVASYNSYSNTNDQGNPTSYASWGSNSQNININYYPNNLGWSFGFGHPFLNYGWGNSYFGGFYPFNYWNDPFMMGWGYNNYFGFNYYPNYFWGYQNFYPYPGNFQRERDYSYNNSRRGSNYNQSRPSGIDIGRREIQNSNYNYSNRNSYNRNNSAPTFSRNSSNFQNQNYINNNIGRSRQNTSTNTTPVRTNSRDNSNPTRTYTPSNNENRSPSRSMDTNSSNSGGSFGGGRSSDGGGRRGGR
ncbi:MAG: hypothetical protein RLZZ577_1374 [Bacteroidota bacterium]|jgi:hypothetical protein